MTSFLVLSLPTRDWNMIFCPSTSLTTGFESTYEGLKLILAVLLAQLVLRFESTYEGLKLFRQRLVPCIQLGFESTYEGLKPWRKERFQFWSDSFESTYEGLKLSTLIQMAMINFYVLSLPTRDWNPYSSLLYVCVWFVLSLPTRDWNESNWTWIYLLFRFWVYLRGIETFYNFFAFFCGF